MAFLRSGSPWFLGMATWNNNLVDSWFCDESVPELFREKQLDHQRRQTFCGFYGWELPYMRRGESDWNDSLVEVERLVENLHKNRLLLLLEARTSLLRQIRDEESKRMFTKPLLEKMLQRLHMMEMMSPSLPFVIKIERRLIKRMPQHVRGMLEKERRPWLRNRFGQWYRLPKDQLKKEICFARRLENQRERKLLELRERLCKLRRMEKREHLDMERLRKMLPLITSRDIIFTARASAEAGIYMKIVVNHVIHYLVTYLRTCRSFSKCGLATFDTSCTIFAKKNSCLIWQAYKNVISLGAKFSAATSAKGGIGIRIGSHTINAPKYLSLRHPIIQKALFADKRSEDIFSRTKSKAPRSIFNTAKRLNSFVSPNVCGFDWISAKPNLESIKAGTGFELNVVESFAKRNKPNDDEPKNSFRPLIQMARRLCSFALGTGCGAEWASAKLKSESLYGGMDSESAFRENIGRSNKLTENEAQRNSAPNSYGAKHGTKAVTTKITSASWVVATAAPHHATGNRDLLHGFVTEHDDQFVHAMDGVPMPVKARGAVVTDKMVLPDVWFVPGLKSNMVSVSQLAEQGYCVGFSCDECCIRSAGDGKIVGKARLGKDELYKLDFLKVSLAM